MASFIKNSLSLISGNIVAQSISIATMPLITRLYTPEQFGVFSVIMSIVAVLGPISTLRLNEVIILPDNNEEANNIFILSWSFTLTLTILLFFLSIIFLGIFPLGHFPIVETYKEYILIDPLRFHYLR